MSIESEKKLEPEKTGQERVLSDSDPESNRRIEALKKRYFMYPHFIDGVATGEFSELSEAEIRRIVQEHYFSFDPLVRLSEEEEALVGDQVLDHLSKALNRGYLKILCGPILYDGEVNLYTEESAKRGWEKDKTTELKPMPTKDKLRLFFNPASWYSLRLNYKNGNGGVAYYGNRNLVGPYDQYFETAENFTRLISDLRERTGVKKLRVLDIGCGMGMALEDMKKIDPNLETHGMTQEQEPAMFEADFFHYLSAERMPADFRNKFHFINSQISFRYFIFQHIALRNTLLSLAKGGFARLGISYDRIHTNPKIEQYFRGLVPGAKSSYEAMKVLMTKEMDKIDVLRRAGKIKIETSKRFYDNGCQGYLGIEKLEDFDEEKLND